MSEVFNRRIGALLQTHQLVFDPLQLPLDDHLS